LENRNSKRGKRQAFGHMADIDLQRGILAGCSRSIQKQWRVARKRKVVASENEEPG
jgi:hypothetical protein